MAEAPTVEATTAPAAGPDGLDTAIAEMEAQLFPSAGQTQTQAPGAAATATPAGQQAPTEQPAGTTPAQEPGGSSETDEEPEPAPGEQPLPTSRMGRLRQQLTHAEDKARTAEQQLQQRVAHEGEALRTFVDLVLPDAEFDNLRIKAEGGDWEAKQRLDLARQWRQMVAPIADLAHRAQRQQFDAALQELRTLDGMDADGHQKLLNAASPQEKLHAMWTLARKASDDAHKARIAELEGEVQALKTNKAANGSQPANGGAPGQRVTGLAGLIDPKTGLLSEAAQNWGPDEIRAHFSGAAA